MATNPQPFIPPRKGEEILDTHFRDIADGLNYANEVRSGQPSTYLRWAVTCQDFDNTYPTQITGNVSFPFKWIYLLPDQDDTFPVRNASLGASEVEHEPISSDPDGYVINRSPAVSIGYPFAGSSQRLISYLPENSLILVGYGEGHYWVASRDYCSTVSATCTETINAADSNLLTSETWPARTPSSFAATLLSYNSIGKMIETSVTFTAYNEWTESIEAFSLLKLSLDTSGRWVVIAAECNGPLEGSSSSAEEE
jgi:hypothetical protein